MPFRAAFAIPLSHYHGITSHITRGNILLVQCAGFCVFAERISQPYRKGPLPAIQMALAGRLEVLVTIFEALEIGFEALYLGTLPSRYR